MKTMLPYRLTVAALALGAAIGCAAAATNAPVSAREELDGYRMVKMDKLVFKIDQDPLPENRRESVAPLVVNARGDLEVPVSRYGDTKVVVRAQGRTVLEVKNEIKQMLDAQYYKSASITLYLETSSPRPGHVTFYGEIKGNYPLPPGEPKYLSEVILEMKPSDFANLKKVKLMRADPVTKKVITRVINVDEILSKGLKDKDAVLQDGDTIGISAKMLNF